MQKNIQLSNISIKVICKDVKNTHLSVYPLDGSVVLVTPKKTRHEVARAYAISKIHWIRAQQNRFKKQERELPLKFIDRESHHLWGRRYLMKINYKKEKLLLNNFSKFNKSQLTIALEFRTIKDKLMNKGKRISKFETFTDHYRRFINKNNLVKKIKKSFKIIYLKESKGFSKFKKEDPCLIRLIAIRKLIKT